MPVYFYSFQHRTAINWCHVTSMPPRFELLAFLHLSSPPFAFVIFQAALLLFLQTSVVASISWTVGDVTPSSSHDAFSLQVHNLH